MIGPVLRQSFIVFEKPSILSENLDELQLPYNLIFFAETLHTFPTYQYLQKGVRDFCLDLALFAKIKKIWFLHTYFLYFH